MEHAKKREEKKEPCFGVGCVAYINYLYVIVYNYKSTSTKTIFYFYCMH